MRGGCKCGIETVRAADHEGGFADTFIAPVTDKPGQFFAGQHLAALVQRDEARIAGLEFGGNCRGFLGLAAGRVA